MDGRWIINWTEYTANSYLYGSRIQFIDRGHVHFINELLPPGTVVKTWYSRTNYQAMRIEPTLPMIDGESAYLLQSRMEMDLDRGMYFKIVFYGKNGEKEGQVFMRDRELEFMCPLKTYAYEIQLIAAGAHEFHFHDLRLREIDAADYLRRKKEEEEKGERTKKRHVPRKDTT